MVDGRVLILEGSSCFRGSAIFYHKLLSAFADFLLCKKWIRTFKGGAEEKYLVLSIMGSLNKDAGTTRPRARRHTRLSREKVETDAIKSRDHHLLLTEEIRCAAPLP